MKKLRARFGNPGVLTATLILPLAVAAIGTRVAAAQEFTPHAIFVVSVAKEAAKTFTDKLATSTFKQSGCEKRGAQKKDVRDRPGDENGVDAESFVRLEYLCTKPTTATSQLFWDASLAAGKVKVKLPEDRGKRVQAVKVTTFVFQGTLGAGCALQMCQDHNMHWTTNPLTCARC